MAKNKPQPEKVQATPVNTDEPAAMATMARAEIDSQITTAKAHPRDIATFHERAIAIATMDEDVAASCNYTLKRKKKGGGYAYITGMSIRLAEIVLACWGNVAASAEIIDEDENWVYCRGQFRDRENNVSIRVMGRRRIRDADNRKFSMDMIQTTGMACCSIVLRNATFHGIPGGLLKPIYDAAKNYAVGNARTLAIKRDKLMARLAVLGATEDRVLAAMECENICDIDADIMAELIGLGTAIKDGETSVDEAFPEVAPAAPSPAQAAAGTTKETPNPHKTAKPGQDAAAAAEPPANEPATGDAEQDATANTEPGGDAQAEPGGDALGDLLGDLLGDDGPQL